MILPSPRVWCLVSLAVLVAACRGETVKKVTPRLSVDPVAVAFGEVKLGTTSELPVTLISQSSATVTIASVVLDDGEGGAAPAGLELGEVPASVPGLGDQTVLVRFTPAATGPVHARLIVTSDDAEHPTIELEVDAVGTSPVLAVLPTCDASMGCHGTVTATPPAIDFGEEPFGRQIPLPSTELPILQLGNTGDAELVIHALAIEGEDAAAFGFEGNATVPEGGLKIAPGDMLGVSLRFTPLDEVKLDYAAQIRVESDDLAAPSVVVALSGKLGPNGPPKVCANIIRVENPNEPAADFDTEEAWSPLLDPAGGYDFRGTRDIRPRARVSFSALSSGDQRTCTADPEDGRLGLTWKWTLTKVPSGVTGVTLLGANTPTPVLTAQDTITSGDYEVSLTVSDAQGHEASTTLAFAVALKTDLAVELAWNQPEGAYQKVDLDLHVVRPGSEPFSWFDEGAQSGAPGNTSGDLHGLAYALFLQPENPGYDFDWGDPGPSDDPKLNLDDTGNGRLVELASLDHPGRDASCRATECRYQVLVHYFEDGRALSTPPTCTVDGTTCHDGEPCTCPGAGEMCVADEAPAGAAPTGSGRCLVAPELSVRVFVEGGSTPLAVVPVSGTERLGAPCQLLHVADVVWPGEQATNPGPPRVEPVGSVSRYGVRYPQSLSCSPNVPVGGSSGPNWYGAEAR